MIYLKTSKDGKQSKSWLVVFIIICIPCTLGRVGNSSLSIHVLWNEIRTFLSSVVCSKPLTYAVVSLWPDLFQREVYCNHSGRPARGRTVNNINIFWQILVCNMNSLQSVFLKVWLFFFFFVLLRAIFPFNSYLSLNHVRDSDSLEAWCRSL